MGKIAPERLSKIRELLARATHLTHDTGKRAGRWPGATICLPRWQENMGITYAETQELLRLGLIQNADEAWFHDVLQSGPEPGTGYYVPAPDGLHRV